MQVRSKRQTSHDEKEKALKGRNRCQTRGSGRSGDAGKATERDCARARRERHDPPSLAQAAVTVEWFEPNRSDAADPNCRTPTRKFTAAAIGDRSAPRKHETGRGATGRRALDELGLSASLRASLD